MSDNIKKLQEDFISYCEVEGITVKEDFLSKFKGKKQYLDLRFSDKFRQKDIYGILEFFLTREIEFGLTFYKRTITKEQANDFLVILKVKNSCKEEQKFG